MNASIMDRLAVCNWSLQSTDPKHLIEQMREINLDKIQLALDPLRENPGLWGSLPNQCAAAGLRLVSGMFVTIGEDYSSLESIRRTGGVVPDATWDDNWRNIQANAEIAARLGIGLVTFHAGFLPHDDSDPEFRKLLDRIARIADLFAEKKIDLGFETGQETAETLETFLAKLGRTNVGVNFDPANLILYEKGSPIQALRALGPRLKQCHIKDATKTKQPGTWGEEVAVGTGEVDWRSFFQTLEALNYTGYLCIEREAGNRRLEDIRTARRFVESLVTTTG